MRGLALNGNLLATGATFVREMVRVAAGGAAIAVEVWSVPAAGLAGILLAEPSGLSIWRAYVAAGDRPR